MLSTGGSQRVQPRRQRGVVMLLALIVLVAMSLTGIALFRSVDSGVVIVGNLSMQKSATRSGDAGAEAAIVWLGANSGGSNLYTANGANGYVAAGLLEVPSATQTWAQYWDVLTATHAPVTLAADAAGNQVSYLIQRHCQFDGAPNAGGTNCVFAPSTSGAGSSKGAGNIALTVSNVVYYRVTAKIVGPRNTTSYIQTIVAM